MNNLKDLIRKIVRCVSISTMPLRYHTYGYRFPKHLSLSIKEAEKVLSDIRPDNGGSCLCQNKILAQYDLHIIVPVYNTSAYLTECLDSIFKQQTAFSFFVSVIDDGSTDCSPMMLDDYHTLLKGTIHYDRTEIIHQTNQGPSGARNKALEIIRGKYVMFVDSDDKLMSGAIESLMNAALSTDADIAEGNFDSGSCHGFMWGKVYRAQLFQNIHFPPGYWFEDTINIFFLYPKSRKTVHVDGIHCYYRFNQDSIMNSFQGNARTIDSLWVSRRVLTDYFSSGNKVTTQLFHDYLCDVLSTASHFLTLNNEHAMQALFIICHHILISYFKEASVNKTILPKRCRLLLDCMKEHNYRKFRIITSLNV